MVHDSISRHLSSRHSIIKRSFKTRENKWKARPRCKKDMWLLIFHKEVDFINTTLTWVNCPIYIRPLDHLMTEYHAVFSILCCHEYCEGSICYLLRLLVNLLHSRSRFIRLGHILVYENITMQNIIVNSGK